MRTIKLSLIVLAMLFCSCAQASYFEYCYLDGQVVAASRAEVKSSKIDFLISHSVASTLKSERSYLPQVCSKYVGKTIKMEFHTKQKTQYTVGDRLKVRQVVLGPLTPNGIVTLTSWEAVNP
jgi:hypothetical protein